MSTRKNGNRRRKPAPEAPAAGIHQSKLPPEADSPRKAAFKAVAETVKMLDANSDPVTVGQADVHYLIFRAANAPGAEFANRMRTIAALAVLAMEYHEQGYVRYEGHISHDPELDMLQEAFPAAPPQLIAERRAEFLAALREQSRPEPPAEPPKLFVPEPEPAPAPPPTRFPWELSVIQFGPGN